MDIFALETLLAAVHMVAILTLIVFQSSQAALCRSEWMSPAVLQRLHRLDVILWTVVAFLLATGVARLLWGAKGVEWYSSRPLFHLKMTIVLAMLALAVVVSVRLRKWLTAARTAQTLPSQAAIDGTRRLIMTSAHLLPVAAVVAVYWARGW